MDTLHGLVRSIGLDVVRYQPTTHPLARRASLLQAHGVDLVLDVGASDGEYSAGLRRLGYRGRIISFEPLPDVAKRLRERSAADEAWTTKDFALGAESDIRAINIAGNSSSSSLLPMLPEHERYAPGTGTIGKVEIMVHRLDDIADDVIGTAERPFLKIDTQGFEGRVLDGASATLSRIVGLQVELSIVPLYEGAPTWIPMAERISAYGYELMGVEPGFSDPVTGRLLQFDGLFFRPEMTGLPA